MEAELLGTGASTDAVAASQAFRVGPFDDPDRYEIGEPVEAGAEGILYRGRLLTPTSRLSLPVAVKALQPAYAGRIDQWAARWRDQVELLRSLQIPGLVGVREGFVGPLPHHEGADIAGRNLYLVMNWVAGEALDHWVLHHRGIDVRNALKLLLPVAVAVDTMHGGQLTGSVPVVHRDIKPANILIGQNGSVLVDFGLTKGLSVGRPVGRAGTPGYIAPEVVAGGGYTPAADRYAFGATVFFLLTGRHPPSAAQPDELRRLLETSPLGGGSSDAGTIPAELVERVVTMLDPDPLRRPAALANWIAQLRQSSLDDEVLTVRLAPPAPARPRRSRATRSTGGASPTVSLGTAGIAGGVGGPIGSWPATGPSRSDTALSGPSGTQGVLTGATSGPGPEPSPPPQRTTGLAASAGFEHAPAAAAHRRGAHLAPRHSRHTRHRVATSRVALIAIFAVAVAIVGSDAGAATRPNHPALGPATARTGAGTVGGQGTGGQILPGNVLPLPGGPGEENAKSPVVTPTTVAYPGAGACFQSYNPACGPLKWSPPVFNQGLTVSFTYSPADPLVGQTVTFTVTASDPDDSGVVIDGASYGVLGGAVGNLGSAASAAGLSPNCPARYGTWTPPPHGAPGRVETPMTFSFKAAGSYQVYFVASSGRTLNPCQPDPYASTARSATQTVQVQDPPPPPPTTTSTSTTTPTTTPPPTTTPTTVAAPASP